MALMAFPQALLRNCRCVGGRQWSRAATVESVQGVCDVLVTSVAYLTGLLLIVH